VGAAIAAPAPWTARAVISQAWLVAKQVAGPAAEQQQPAERHRVGVDHPFQVRPGEPERLLDMRQGHVDDGQVERDHQLGGGDDG